MKKENKKTFIAFRLSLNDLDKLKEKAKKENRNLSNYIYNILQKNEVFK